MARAVGYYFRVKVTGNTVALTFRTLPVHGNGMTFSEFSRSVSMATQWRFATNPMGNVTQSNPPNLNLDGFYRHYLGMTGTLKWDIPDPVMRAQFTAGLKAIGSVLSSARLIDPVDLDVSKIFRQIVRDREQSPLINMGGKLYRIQLHEEKVSPFKVEEEFKAQVTDYIAALDKQYASKLEEEIKKLTDNDGHPYSLTKNHVMDGWLTWTSDSGPALAKRFEYSPTHVAFGTGVRRIKPDVRERLAQDAMLVYTSGLSVALILSADGRPITMPHSRSGSGSLCTGSISVHSGLDLDGAIELITNIIEMLKTINLNSLLQFTYAGYTLDSSFYYDCCIDPDAPVTTVADDIEETEPIVECDEGTVL